MSTTSENTELIECPQNDCETDEDSPFYFESDHLALRDNADYKKVLRTLTVLQFQRSRVQQQLKELIETKALYMQQPKVLLDKLEKGEEIITPNRMEIAEVPTIGDYDTMPKVKTEEESQNDDKAKRVRGRVMDESKPATFNKLWTYEEQRHLEQLLVEFPPEEKEARRYAKIAEALGTRTPQQVASRIQKYFMKLSEAGMPIPGRKPKTRRIGQTKAKPFYKPTTFFPQFNVPVRINEDDDADGSRIPLDIKPSLSYNTGPRYPTDIEEKLFKTKERILYILEHIREDKVNSIDNYNPDPMAPKCAKCKSSITMRTHWRCHSCVCIIYRCSDCLTAELLDRSFEHLYHKVLLDKE